MHAPARPLSRTDESFARRRPHSPPFQPASGPAAPLPKSSNPNLPEYSPVSVKAWLLGSGGFIPTGRRETTSILVRRGDAALLLDAGTGLRRLLTEPERFEGVKTFDIVLSHFHLDHVTGLGYAPALHLLPTIWAPGRWLHEKDSAGILAPLRSEPLSPFTAEELGEVRELVEGEQQIGGFTISTRRQEKHWGPTAGLRVEDALVLITDTAYDEGSADFAAGATHLLHEAWSTTADAHPNVAHSTAAEAGRVAAAANVRHLTLIHLNPRLKDEQALQDDAFRHMPNSKIGEDGAQLEL
jgi:ribonuclease BN (tRNA processing enzyme)